MRFDLLRAMERYIAVVETGGVRRAALRLNVSQPPLSADLKLLQEELGVPLLERSGRGVVPTAAGRVFFEEARRSLAQAARAIEMTRQAGRGLVGSLRVRFVAGIAAPGGLLQQALLRFRTHHQGVHLELREATTARQLAELQNGGADLALLVPPLPPAGAGAPALRTETLFAAELVLALPEDHPLARRRGRIALSALAGEAWVVVPPGEGPGLHSRIFAACAAGGGFVPQVAQEAAQIDTILGLVAGGLGVALVPRSLGTPARDDERVAGIVFRRLTGAGTPIGFELAAAWRRGEEAGMPALAAFCEALRAAAKAVRKE